MDTDRFKRLTEYFDEASTADEAGQAACIARAHAEDPDLGAELEVLLAEHAHPGGLLEDSNLVAIDRMRAELAGDASEIRLKIEAVIGGDDTRAGTLRAAQSDDDFPDEIGRFRIIRRIGEGGMGTVYEAEQDHPRRRVALKLLRPDLFSHDLLQRFRHEVQVLGQLHHPGIAQIHEANWETIHGQETPYFVMEFVEGRSFLRYVREKKLSTQERLELVARVCDAVHHAHLVGVIHRDLKPANILVEEPGSSARAHDRAWERIGQPKVLDFGVAKVTNSDIETVTIVTDVGRLVGTVPYMSPEQSSGEPSAIDLRTDVYSLGVLLYEVLADKLPYPVRDKPLYEAVRIIHEEEPDPLSSVHHLYRGDIETIVHKALRKNKEERYQSAGALAADLRRYLLDEPIEARPTSALYMLRKFARRNRALVSGALIAIIALVVATIVSVDRAMVADRQRVAAEAGKRAADLNAYRTLLVATSASLAAGDSRAAQRFLEGAAPDLRGWEWEHLNSEFDQSVALIDLGTRIAGIRWPEGGDEIVMVTVSGEVFRWNPDLDETVSNCQLETKGIASARFSADGCRVLVKGAQPAVVDLCDTRDGSLIHRFPNGQFIDLSEDGETIAIASGPGISVYRPAAGTEWRPRALDVLDVTVRLASPELSPDGTRIVASLKGLEAYRGSYGFSTWDTVTGKELVREIGAFQQLGRTWLPDNKRFVFSDVSRHLTIWSEDGGHPSRHRAPRSQLLAVDLTGGTLAAAADQSIQLFSLESHEWSHVFHGHRHPITALAFGRGTRLVSTSGTTIRLWGEKRIDGAIFAHDSYVYAVDFSPDGARALSSSWDGTVRIWSMADEKCVGVIRPQGGIVPGAIFSPDGKWIVTATGSHRIEIWNADTAERQHGWQVGSKGVAQNTLVFNARGNRIAVSGSRQATQVWTFPAGELIDQVLSPILSRSDYSPDGVFLAHVTRASNVSIRDVDASEERASLVIGDDAAFAVQFSPKGDLIGVGYQSGAVRLWGTQSWELEATLEGHGRAVYDLAFTPDGERLATGADDELVIVWDVESGQELLRLAGHQDYVHAVAFSPDGQTLLSGSGDSTIRFWHARPLHERVARATRWRALRGTQQPRVAALLAQLDGPNLVADALRSNVSLSPDDREAALQVLLMTLTRPSETVD